LENLDIANSTAAKHALVPMKDPAGYSLFAMILKYTFSADARGRVELVEEGADPYFVDELHGEDPSKSSIRKPSDLFYEKPGTDVVLVGHAHPPPTGNVSFVDVALRVGPIAKTVRAYGVRAWRAGGPNGVSPGPARPIREPVPLVYELAWGGLDLSEPERPVGEPRNTVGRGVARNPRSLVDQPAAQLEDPAHPIAERNPAPASFGPIHRHWQPRASFAGTYDERWETTKLPLLPDDFDLRFNVCVPNDQWSQLPLRGDEPIDVRGATPEGAWVFSLPRLLPGFSSWVAGKRTDHRTHLDTIVIDADARRVELTFHAAMRLPRKLEMVQRITMLEKSLAAR